MCFCQDSVTPSAFRSRMRRARKEHRCCECRRLIYKGDLYEYASGIWDSEPNQYKTCSRCVKAREAHLKAEGCTPAFGELPETIASCIKDESIYLARFRAARRGEPMPERVALPSSWDERSRLEMMDA